MPFLGRSFYNLLQRQYAAGEVTDVPEWKVRDYRQLSIEDLFCELEQLGVEIDVDQLEVIADQAVSPEEVAESIAPAGEPRDRVYLLLFELWRRLFDDHETISLFCDELDHTIAAYEDDPATNEEDIYILLKELIGILEQNITLGQKPKELFVAVSHYLSHDLESFIYNYIQDLIEGGREMVASELTSNFAHYVQQTLWFDLLKIRLLSGASSHDATAMMARFLEQLQRRPELDLYLDLLHYLNRTGHLELFAQVVREVIPLIKTRQEYVEILDILSEFTHFNDQRQEGELIERLLQQVRQLPPAETISIQDKQKLQELVR